MACNKAAIDCGPHSDRAVRGTSIWFNQRSWLGVHTLAGSLISAGLRESCPHLRFLRPCMATLPQAPASIPKSCIRTMWKVQVLQPPRGWVGSGGSVPQATSRHDQAALAQSLRGVCMFPCGSDSSPVRALARLSQPCPLTPVC